ncbi:hypothetical protein [Corallococcus macrosporus]|uniref:Uncharacterized protein n=1 Tax=Corallococcus macrosporus DSM 14697 TaxID=1189310 RepID=A0A250JPA3_9BACT|nr:hypothetical protein [Corallococcus macrosporus]ATB45302.1 hypothetical protein MYMAC_000887 [Corallococcus macrosporus DSM 14697]
MIARQTPPGTESHPHHHIKCTRTGFHPKSLTVSPGDTVEFLGSTELNQHLHVLKDGLPDHSLFGSDDFLIPNGDTHQSRTLTVSQSAERTTYTLLLKNSRDSLEPMNGTITVNRGTQTC